MFKRGKVIYVEGKVVHLEFEGNVTKVSRDRVIKEVEEEEDAQVPQVDQHQEAQPAQLDQPKDKRVSFQLEGEHDGLRRTRPKPHSVIEFVWNTGEKQKARVKFLGKKDGKQHNLMALATQDDVIQLDIQQDILGWRYVEDPSNEARHAEHMLFGQAELVDCFVQILSKEEQKLPDCQEAMQQELKKFYEMEAVRETHYEGQPLVPMNWVCTKKNDPAKGVEIKARLTVRGDLEKGDARTDSPTVKKESIKLLLAITAVNKWQLSSVDIKSAFLQGICPDRTIFLKPPAEAGVQGIWSLHRPIYGLKDASRLWYKALSAKFKQWGYGTLVGDRAFFYLKEAGELKCIVACHVDDLCLSGEQQTLEKLIADISDAFQVSKIEFDHFKYTGMQISQDESSIILSQSEYVSKLKPMRIYSAEQYEKLTSEDILELKRVIGSINWACQVTRPDLSFDCLDLSLQMDEARKSKCNQANKLIQRAVNYTYEIKLNKAPNIDLGHQILIFADAAHTNKISKKFSTEGRIIFWRVDQSVYPISWKAKKLDKVANSTKSAETLALLNAFDEGIALADKIKDLIGDRPKVIAFTDNNGLKESIYSYKSVTEQRMERPVESMRQCIEDRELDILKWIGTEFMLADVFTKTGASFSFLRQILTSGQITHAQMEKFMSQSCGEDK